MALHLVKLGVGVASVADLEARIAERLADQRARRARVEQVHTTRMVPKRAAEIVDGGSLYWVIKGELSVRQPLLQVRPFVGEDGVGRCHLVLEPVLVRVRPRAMRPFQGWRYMAHADAPPDLLAGEASLADMPDALRRELTTLGLL